MPGTEATSTVVVPNDKAPPVNGEPQLAGGAPLARTVAPGENPLAGLTNVVWTAERVELIKKEICPGGITDDEFRIFIERCKRAQLDPLMGEAFCVPRQVKVEDGRGERWVTKNVFQPAEVGMNARCDRFPDYRGLIAAAYYEKDVIEFDHATGTVKHTAQPNKDRGQLKGAWAICYREGRKPQICDVKLEERIQLKRDGSPVQAWSGKKGETMIEKCARMEARRSTYPNTFGGMTIDAEMPSDEKELNEAPEDTRNRSAQVADRVRQNAGRAVEGEVVKPQQSATAKPAAPAPTPEAPPSEPTLRFGPDKGKLLKELPTEALKEKKEWAETSLKNNSTANWAGTLRKNLKEIDAEIEKRAEQAVAEAIPPPPTEREPGSDDGDEIPDQP